MLKRMNLLAPVALCLISAAGLSACKDSEVSTTAKTTGRVADVQPQPATPTTRPSTDGAAQATDAPAGARPSQDPSEREAAALAAREARAEAVRQALDQAAREADPASATRDRVTERLADLETARRTPVVTATPSVLDFGTMPTGDRQTATVTLTNTSDTIVRLQSCRSSCGCTVPECPTNYDMQPGEALDVDVALSSGLAATRLTKTVTFIFEGHPHLMVNVTSDVVAYITYEPRILDSESNPEGRIVVRSHDDEPFRITGVAPQVIAHIPDEAATEHELFISWDQWSELRQPRRLEISLDHPKTKSVTAAIRNPALTAIPVDRTGADPRRTQREPARAAVHELAQRGEMDALLARIQDGENVDSTDPRGNSLLSIASRHGHVELMSALIERGADVNLPGVNDGVTPLMSAAQSKNANAVRLLLNSGADVDARDYTLGNTALSWAALNGNTETVSMLLDAGAVVGVVSRMTGWTPLLAASGFGEAGAVKLLLEAGGDPEVACQIQGATAIMYAAQTGRVDNVKALLAKGVNLETMDNRGRTVLLFAAGHSGSDAATIKALLDAGANVHAVDPRGMNALDYARGRGDARGAEIVALLEPHFQE